MRGLLPLLALSLMIFLSSINGGNGQDFVKSEIIEKLKLVWSRQPTVSQTKMAEYADVVAEALSKSTIPHSWQEVFALGEMLYAGDSEVFIDKNFMSLKSYAESSNSNPQQLAEMLKTMKINKLKLMERISSRRMTVDRISSKYGILALEKLFSSEPEKSPIRGELKNLRENNQYGELISDRILQSADIHNWAAAEYLVDRIKEGSTPLTETAKQIFIDKKYSEVSEYLNSALRTPEVRDKFKPIFESLGNDKKSYWKAFRAAVDNGFDEISSSLLENTFRRNIVEFDGSQIGLSKYELVGTSTPKSPKYEYEFGSLTAKEEEVPTRNLLFEYKMVKTLREIAMTKKDYPKRNMYFTATDVNQYLLKLTPAEFKSNFDLVKTLLDTVTSKVDLKETMEITMENLRSFMDHPELIEYFGERGVSLPKFKNRRTLVNMAVRYSGFDTLVLVCRAYEVKIDSTIDKKALFIDLLDTQPIKKISSLDFWKKAKYLQEIGALEIPSWEYLESIEGFQGKPEHLSPEQAKLLKGTETPKRMHALSETQKFRDVVLDLPPEYRKYRRNRIFGKRDQNVVSEFVTRYKKPKITMSEIFLEYRGLARLSPAEELAYKSTIKTAIIMDLKNPKTTVEQKANIAKMLRENIGTVEDATITKDILESLVEREHTQLSSELSSLRGELETNQLPKKSTGQPLPSENTFENQLELTREMLYNAGDEFLTAQQTAGNLGEGYVDQGHVDSDVDAEIYFDAEIYVDPEMTLLGECFKVL